MKKCPACNSTRYKKINGNFCCAKCGYINKTNDNINNQIDNQITNS